MCLQPLLQPLLQAMRTRIVDAPAQHAAELRWLDAALMAHESPNWIAHWAATRVDVWHGVAAAAALLGDVDLQRGLQDEASALVLLLKRDPNTLVVADVAVAVARVAQQLANYHRRVFATRDLCWAALTLAVHHDPAKRQDALQVAAAVMAIAEPRSPAIPFDDVARTALFALLQPVASSARVSVQLAVAPVPAFDAAAAEACTITVAQGYAMWRAALPPASHTAQALDQLLRHRDVAGFPLSAEIVARRLDVALLQAAQLDAMAEALTDASHGLAYRRAVILAAALLDCSSPTLVEICLAVRGLVDSVESVWWDVLGIVALAPLAAACAHDAEPTDRTAAELRAAAQLAHHCFGHRTAWAQALNTPPLHAALQRCWLQMHGTCPSPDQISELSFAGTSAACKANVLRSLGELPAHPSAPSGWLDATSWIAAMCDDVFGYMPEHGTARSLRAWYQPVAIADLVQMHVPSPPVRDLVLP